MGALRIKLVAVIGGKDKDRLGRPGKARLQNTAQLAYGGIQVAGARCLRNIGPNSLNQLVSQDWLAIMGQ